MRILYGLLLGAILLFPSFADAAVISEIMYDIEGTDTGREWIEVYNDSASDIDLSTWKLFEAGVSHKITSTGSALLAAGMYAVLADSPEKFLADNPGFSGALFDSAFSLGNGGEAFALRDSLDASIDSVTYENTWGGAGDGNSLQRKADGAWVAAAPTPGTQTTAIASAVVEEDSSSGSSSEASPESSFSAHSSQAVATVSYEEPELAVTAGRSRLGFVGVPLSFEARVKSVKNTPVTARSIYSWSMGDGTKENGQFIAHAYEFPGEYIVVLNASNGGAQAVSKVSVKVVAPKISIKAEHEHVEIENADSNELNLGGFIIESGGSRFVVPEDTLIAPKSAIRLSTAAMRFHYGESVKIKDPKSRILATARTPSIRENPMEVVISLPEGLDPRKLRELLEANP